MLATLTVYRPVLDVPAVAAVLRCLTDAMPEDYALAYAGLRDEGVDSLSDCIRNHLLFDENPFAHACAQGSVDEQYLAAAARDVRLLDRLAQLAPAQIKREMAAHAPQLADLIEDLPEWRVGTPLDLNELLTSYRQNGCGLFARARAFHWEKGTLTAVKNPDPIGEMIGYEWQREAVIQNTRALHAGKPCNNVLLHGDSGTGKSATIKSLLNLPEFYNLRIIEVAKNSLEELTEVQRLVSSHTQKFILYIDDLAFQQEDRGYSALKSALEGGLERRPENVAIYVTSNRRHMLRESFNDRGTDEIHRKETIEEQTSLSDRFGLRLPYLSLGKQEFLDMVDQLAANDGITLDPETLHAQANMWEIRHSGRTPRTATQFIEHLHTQF
jgi:hypothetical protein